MSYITEFSISGLAGRKNLYECKLDRNVNIFFGVNGSGKTSILRLLDAAMSCDATRIANVPFEAAEIHIYSEQYKKVFTYSVERSAVIDALSGEKATQQLLFDDASTRAIRRSPARQSLGWNISPPLPPDSAGKWRHSYLPISRMHHAHRKSSQWIDDAYDETFDEQLKQIWSSYFTNVLQAVRVAQSQGLANILQAVLAPKDLKDSSTELDTKQAYANLASFLRRQGSSHILPNDKTFKQRYLEDSRLRSVVSDIDEVESRIATAMAPRAKLQELIGRMFSNGKSAFFDENNIGVRSADNVTISLGLLSSGEKQVLRLLVESLRVDDNAMLIDEPELSMHIDWQRELIGIMRDLNPRAQIIAATHSPEVMAETDDDKIFRL